MCVGFMRLRSEVALHAEVWITRRTEFDRPLARPAPNIEDAVQILDGRVVKLVLQGHPDQVILELSTRS